MQYDLFKEKVKKAVIVVRPDSPAALSLGKEVAHWLKERKITAYSHPQRPLGKGIQRLKPAQVKSLQLAIVLGGDGTYLEAVSSLKILKSQFWE